MLAVGGFAWLSHVSIEGKTQWGKTHKSLGDLEKEGEKKGSCS